jgi:hypothetical protein
MSPLTFYYAQAREIREGYVILTLFTMAMIWWSTKSLGKKAE